jgi:hypothetical protein
MAENAAAFGIRDGDERLADIVAEAAAHTGAAGMPPARGAGLS